jgi:hypothetical protein
MTTDTTATPAATVVTCQGDDVHGFEPPNLTDARMWDSLTGVPFQEKGIINLNPPPKFPKKYHSY